MADTGRTQRKGTIREMKIADLPCRLFVPAGYDDTAARCPVVYVNGEIPIEEVVNEAEKAGVSMTFLLLSVQPESWNDDFTPWSAQPFRKGETAPAGRADGYLRRLTGEIKPYMDTHYRTMPEARHTALIGYSLGGLAALYAIYRTDVFGIAGSLSGSLWYDDFCEYMEKNAPCSTDIGVYLSLGRKESRSKDPRMAKVAACTERAQELLLRQIDGAASEDRVCLEWNDGGHFHEIPRRFARALAWVSSAFARL